MSAENIKQKLDSIIFLLENLPHRMCDEMSVRRAIRNQQRVDELQENIEFHHSNMKELNKIMFGVE